jgi:predicted dehydrogenase
MGDTSTRGVLVVGVDAQGKGFGSRAHVPAVQALAETQLVGVCTSREESARAVADQLTGVRPFWDLDTALAHPAVDIVMVAVRVGLHADVATRALDAGKSVYCEWPLGLGTEEAERVAATALSRGSASAIGTQGRFSPEVRAARDAISRGAIGRPLSFQVSHLLPRFPVDSHRAWMAHQDQASGALFVASAHATDTLQFLLSPVASIAAVEATQFASDRYADSDVAFVWTASDTVSWVARLQDGCVGSAHVANTAVGGPGFSLRILGEEGQVVVLADSYASFGAPSAFLVGEDGAEPLAHRAAEGGEEISLAASDPGRNVAFALRSFVAEGVAFRPSFSDGVALHRLLDAVQTSSSTRSWVDVDHD